MVDSHDGGARGDRENLDHRFRALEMHIVEVDGKVDALATLMIQRFDGVDMGIREQIERLETGFSRLEHKLDQLLERR